MVDLHCHILPDLDDGPATLEGSLEMARAFVSVGVNTVAATPHIRDDHPFSLELLDARMSTLRSALDEAGIGLRVVPGGEVALSKVTELDDEALTSLCIGEGPSLLVESPFTQAPSLLETALFDLQLRGFRPLLAHPERSVTFIGDRERLERLAERGIACSVTAMSVAGSFGATVRNFTLGLFSAGLVHNIASDAHAAEHRGPGFAGALAALEAAFEVENPANLTWFTDAAPRAMLEGQDLPGEPPALTRRPTGWRRIRERVGLA